jgi:hypothetical protein
MIPQKNDLHCCWHLEAMTTFEMENGEPYTTTQMNEYGLWVISVD